VRGHGTIADEREVHVGEDRLRAGRAVILATGSTALIPPISGLLEADPWTKPGGDNGQGDFSFAVGSRRRRSRSGDGPSVRIAGCAL